MELDISETDEQIVLISEITQEGRLEVRKIRKKQFNNDSASTSTRTLEPEKTLQVGLVRAGNKFREELS